MLELQARSMPEVLQYLQEKHPELSARIIDKHGAPLRFVRIFIDGKQTDGWQEILLSENAKVQILVALAGG